MPAKVKDPRNTELEEKLGLEVEPSDAAEEPILDPREGEEEEADTGNAAWTDTDAEDLGESEDPMAGIVGAAGKDVDDGSFLKQKNKKTLSFDFVGVDDGPPKIEPGIYFAKLTDIDVQESSDPAKHDQWIFTYVILKGPEKNRAIKQWCSMSPAARWKAAQTLKALGSPIAGRTGELDVEKVIGTACKLHMQNRTWDGTERSEVKNVLPADEEALAALRDARAVV
jgi:hypothetical protein